MKVTPFSTGKNAAYYASEAVIEAEELSEKKEPVVEHVQYSNKEEHEEHVDKVLNSYDYVEPAEGKKKYFDPDKDFEDDLRELFSGRKVSAATATTLSEEQQEMTNQFVSENAPINVQDVNSLATRIGATPDEVENFLLQNVNISEQ